MREVADITIKILHIDKAITIRLKFGRGNSHYPQCMNVPEKLDCIQNATKKFVYAEAWKRKSEDKNRSSKRLITSKNDETINRLFPNHCMIWKSISIKVNGKKQLAKTILTYHAESRVKEAAEKRNDEKMLTDIKGKDLIPYFIWKKKISKRSNLW